LAGSLAGLCKGRELGEREVTRQLWIGGFPSYYGGVDTVLNRFIDLLLTKRVAVHLVPRSEPDGGMRRVI